MRSNIYAVLLLAGALTSAGSAVCSPTNPGRASAPAATNEKVEICHKGRVISVDAHAVQAHLAHGDSRGSCFVDVIGRAPKSTANGTTNAIQK